MKNIFRTEIKLKKGDFPEISYKDRIMLIGSCFSDNIGEKFKYFKFHSLSNPFGVTYNPISIANQIDRIINKREYAESDLIEKEECFNSYELHGSFDNLNKNHLLNTANQQIELSAEFIKKATHLYITLGTSWVYQLKENDQIVNNCHKKPGNLFTKRLLSVQEVYTAINNIVKQCRRINLNSHIVFSISPVRHLKDGFAENSLSKSILRVAISMMEAEKRISYFPSNEIVNDDLREYRFYNEDMVHPNSTAVNYIWDKIVETQISENDKNLMGEIDKINKATSHRAFNQKTESHKKFIQATINSIESISEKHPEIYLEAQLNELKKSLSE